MPNSTAFNAFANGSEDRRQARPRLRARRAELGKRQHIIAKLASRLCQAYHLPQQHDELLSVGQIAWCEAERRYDPDARAQLSTYAFPYVRGAMLTAVRRELRRRVRCSAPLPQHAHDAHECLEVQGLGGTGRVLDRQEIAPFDDPESALARKQWQRCLYQALAELPPRQRTVIEHLYLKQYSIRQVSRTLEICETRVRRLRSLGLRTLQRSLKSMGIDRDILLEQ
ncbi:MAG: sigma-70 family RNA polymerase sigma factor [Myxococcota bacterium]|jgi:RNA polymerase sigma factor (sigma-70 family)|nr:sigma-70 family RNA polymerase sigma factor [Myxococcota bacterium]